MPQDGVELARVGLVWAGLVMVLLAAITDIRRFVIPNRIPLVLLLLGLLYGFLSPGFPWLGHGVALLLVFAVGFVLFSVGLFGGGDVKLMSALAFWAGLEGLWPFAFITALAGGAVSLLYLGRACWRRRGEKKGWRAVLGTTVPYGVAIAAGGVYLLLQLSGGVVSGV